jgi:hypothetical protein
MGKAVCNMIKILDQEKEDQSEGHGPFSVGFRFETAMASVVV